MTDFICFKCKSKIKTKRWSKSKIEVKCACPHEFDYIRTDDDDDAIEKFLTQFHLYDPEIDNTGEEWSDSAAKHLEELWLTSSENITKTELCSKLLQRFGRSIGALLSQLKHMEDSSTQKYKIKNKTQKDVEIIAPNVEPNVARSKYPLYHLSSIENLQSILSEGILSHDLSMEKNPKRVADAGIVEYRKTKTLSSGYPLTHYANFYFKPENAMLWRILKEAPQKHDNPENIIVFEINLDINQDDIFVSDGNCAKSSSMIEPVSISTLPAYSAHDIFSSIDEMKTKSSWSGDEELKRKFMAECLIPQKVGVSSIRTIHVQNDVIQEKIHDIIQEKFPNLRNIEVKINSPMFFS